MVQGSTVREHLEAAERQGADVPELHEGVLPPEAEHLWRWFSELHATRGATGFGPSVISYSDIAAWAALTGRAVEPWEVTALRRTDMEYMRHWSARQDK